jgi:hypothetical protein
MILGFRLWIASPPEKKENYFFLVKNSGNPPKECG